MTKYLPPMFARLYISMITALIASIFLTLLFTKDYLSRDDINDFLQDTHFVYQTLEQDWQNKHLTPVQYFKDAQAYPHFNLQWIPNWEGVYHCQECSYLSTIDHVQVYSNVDDMFISIYPVSGTGGAVKISDRPEFQLSSDYELAWYQDAEDIVLMIIFIVSLVVIGSILYYPAKKLQNQISALRETQRKFGEGDLTIQADENIPEPLKDLAVNFNQMATEINNTVSENQVFAQAVPHEIRTPLSRIQLATGLLRKYHHTEPQLTLLDNIDSYIDDLNELTNQVIAFARLNSAEVSADIAQQTPIQLNDFITSRVTLLTDSNSKSIEVKIDIAPHIHLLSDPIHLRLLIDNLLKNALMHAHSKVTVSVEDNLDIELSVEDDGEGIPEESHQLVFVPFARLDKSRNNHTGGLGLGLAIAKTAAKKMNGTLTLENTKLSGAKFVFRSKR